MKKRLLIGLLSAGLVGAMVPGMAAAEDSGRDACKKGGWKDLVDASGRDFASQGECVSYIGQGGGSGNDGGFLLAIAYSDLNGKQGFQAGSSDVLIAKFVDVDGNGPDEGDRVVTDRYPTDVDATSFARWGKTEHTVASAHISAYTLEARVYHSASENCDLKWRRDGVDWYEELSCSIYANPAGYVSIFDSAGLQEDFITVKTPTVSQPPTPVSVEAPTVDGDSDFIDVEILTQ